MAVVRTGEQRRSSDLAGGNSGWWVAAAAESHADAMHNKWVVTVAACGPYRHIGLLAHQRDVTIMQDLSVYGSIKINKCKIKSCQ